MQFLRIVSLVLAILCLAMTLAQAEKDTTKPTTFTKGLLDCTGAQPLMCNVTVNGDNTGLPNNVETYSCVSWNESGGEQVWEVVLTETSYVTITLTPQADCDLDLFVLLDCDEATCAFYADRSIAGYADPGTYYVVVDGYEGAECRYELTTTCYVQPPPESEPGSSCVFESVCMDWDFAENDHGFTPADCGGAAVWEYGAEATVPQAPANVWGTVLNNHYVNNAGQSLVSPPFAVNADCNWMEIKHYVYTEGYTSGSGNIYDGGNVSVDGIIITPAEGYEWTAFSASPCIGGTNVFAGDTAANVPVRTWGTSCFDLSPFMGSTIQVSFNFGSDSSVTRPGWYLSYVKLGTADTVIGTEQHTWGSVKSLFR